MWGIAGAKIGMHSFGSSAPIKDLLAKFGVTAASCCFAAAKQQLALGKE
jgi:transketolase